MKKTILITGATDGIGFATAKRLVVLGHRVIIHGRNQNKLNQSLAQLAEFGHVTGALADFSDLNSVSNFAQQIKLSQPSIDVLINNAGVLKSDNQRVIDGMDLRFIVNTIAPYLLTRALIPIMPNNGRIINLSSAAQSSFHLPELIENSHIESEIQAYAQSKLAITMWSQLLGSKMTEGPLIVSINPGSLLGSKMVKDGFGMKGKDLSIGASILVEAALSSSFEGKSGTYFDNDVGEFSDPHPDAQNEQKCQSLVAMLDKIILPFESNLLTEAQ